MMEQFSASTTVDRKQFNHLYVWINIQTKIIFVKGFYMEKQGIL